MTCSGSGSGGGGGGAVVQFVVYCYDIFNIYSLSYYTTTTQ